MWRLKQLIPKDQAGLEGKTVDVGSLHLQIRSVIAQGGFSCVYLARDAQSGKLFALKHITCSDSESLDLVKKEVSALKVLRGHPNIVALEAHSKYDKGSTNECFLVTKYCEKTMVDVLDNHGAAHSFDEKRLLLMFLDVCNAVYAMHCQSPPMAHRDLKAENLLLGSDGHWKLCDFGSVSTNHRRFEKEANMGVEEDIIRKHTTPAYRAPEMWDLYRRDFISEKVDIWALGCLLYRMAYLKLAFDGESKLQILNGNYRVPDLPKYSSSIIGLIKDMLNSSPEARPNAMQVWLRVNNALPVDCQKSGPDKAPGSLSSQNIGGNVLQSRQASVVPTRAPPPPPQKNAERGSSSFAQKESADHNSVSVTGKGGAFGSFWSSHYAQEASHDDDKSSPGMNESPGVASQLGTLSKSPVKGMQGSTGLFDELQSTRNEHIQFKEVTRTNHAGLNLRKDCQGDPKWDDYGDYGSDLRKREVSSTNVSQRDPQVGFVQQTKGASSEFVADFQNATIFSAEKKHSSTEDWQLEMESSRTELKQLQMQKLELATKCEKLTLVCQSQRLEIEELKTALAASINQSTSFQADKRPFQTQQPSSLISQKQGQHLSTFWDLEESVISLGASPSESQGWKAFSGTNSRQVQRNKNGIPQYTNGSARLDRPQIFSMEDDKHSVSFSTRYDAGSGAAKKETRQGSEFDGSTGAYNANSFRGASCPPGHSQPVGWAGF